MKVTMKHTAVKFIATLLSGAVFFLACPVKYAEAFYYAEKIGTEVVGYDKLFDNYTVWNTMTDTDSFPTDGDRNRYNTAIESGWHYLNLISGTLSTAKTSPNVVYDTYNNMACESSIGLEATLSLDERKKDFYDSAYLRNNYESLDREAGLFIKFAGYDQDGEKRYYLRWNAYGKPDVALYAPVLNKDYGQTTQSSLGLINTSDMRKRYVVFDFWSKHQDEAKKAGIDYDRYSNLMDNNLSVIAKGSNDLVNSATVDMFKGYYFPAESTDTWVFRKSGSSNGFNILPAGVFWRLYNDVKDSNGNITLKPDGGIESTSLKDDGLSLSVATYKSPTAINTRKYITLNSEPATDFMVCIGDPWESRTVKGTITIGRDGDGCDNFQIGNEKMVTFYAPGSKLDVGETGVVSISGTVVMHGTMDIKGTVVVQPGSKLLIYGGDTSVNKLRDMSDGWQDITRDTNVYLEGDLIILEDAAVAFVSGLETTFEVQGNGSIYNHGLLWLGCSTLYLSGKSDFVNYGELYAGLTPEYPDFQLLSADYDDGHLGEYEINFKRFYENTASYIGNFARNGVSLEARNRLVLHNRYNFANGKIVADKNSSVENRGTMVLESNYTVYGNKAVGFGQRGPEFSDSDYNFSLNIMDTNDQYTFKEAKRPLS